MPCNMPPLKCSSAAVRLAQHSPNKQNYRINKYYVQHFYVYTVVLFILVNVCLSISSNLMLMFFDTQVASVAKPDSGGADPHPSDGDDGADAEADAGADAGADADAPPVCRPI